ncbi:MAG TPA: hypothetical protein VL485_21745 [Ktedonobacteraceae bacterium]|nr:hypothetical protein [Ktedonobacteraceae bacterium]
MTGGRAFVTLELARQFSRQGHRVIVAESVPVHLCRYSRCVRKHYRVPRPNAEPEAYIDALIDIIRREQIDLLIPTCEEIFFIAQGRERLQAHCHVFVASFAQMQRLHSKWDFIQCASQHHLTVPDTHYLASQNDLRSFLAHNQRPFVLKPVFSRFATNVICCADTRSFPPTLASLPISARYPWVAQEMMVGQAFCTYSIASQGRLLAHTVYPLHYRAGQGACIHFEAVEHPAIDQWVARFVECEQFSGQIAFDMIVTADGTVYPLECNPRATSGIHLFQDALPTAFLSGQGSQENVLRPDPNVRAMIAVAMLLYGLPTVLRSWTGFSKWVETFFHARDVIFATNDIKPFLLQPLILWYNWKESRKLHLSIQEFSTLDIEWNGPGTMLSPQKELYL